MELILVCFEVLLLVCTNELDSNSNCDFAKSTNKGDGMAGNGLCRRTVNEDVDNDGVVFLLSFLVT